MGLSKRSTYTIGSFAFLLIFTISCSSKKYYPNWMIGKWSSSYDGIAIQESWFEKDGIIQGETVWKFDDKTRIETLKMYYRNDSLVYRVKMPKKVLEFVCLDPKNDTLVFINNANDFPKRINYVKPTTRLMTVWIDNFSKDPNKMSFPFKKID